MDTSNSDTSSTPQQDTSNSKYFFVVAAGTKYIDVSTLVGEATKDVSEIDKILEGIDDEEVKLKGKIPVTTHNNIVMESANGLFVPSMIENYIKTMYGLSEAYITFMREMTKEEYDFDCKYKENLKKPKPLEYNTISEIEDLLMRGESGNLSITDDLKPEFARTEEEKDLMDLNLPMNLFDSEGLWEESDDSSDNKDDGDE
jgi:hypothetical protein